MEFWHSCPKPTNTPPAVMIYFVSLDFEKWGQTDGLAPCVNRVITTGCVWVSLVVQYVGQSLHKQYSYNATALSYYCISFKT